MVCGLPIEYNTTASLINQHGVDLDQAVTMIKDELIQIEALQGSQPMVLAAPAAPSQPPPSNNSSSQQQPDHNPYLSRPFNSWTAQNMSYPNWAWWTPPPCPYPTQNRSFAEALQYLTFTKPDISNAVQHFNRFSVTPLNTTATARIVTVAGFRPPPPELFSRHLTARV
ncbi:hypothetical protein E3N88_25340 [Mikania micrantha]|uniref:Uncharacterized protein n=1 Tax=Mikania micrantha TaxID=192012 RepID=A0A5N6N5F9_9ASTR|nr:hypothetical protein E3N88_25340 [Mikania micrantha]